MKTESYKNILKNTTLFGGVQGLNILIALVRNKIVSELLGPAGTGLVSMYNSCLQLIQNSTDFGIARSGVREMSVVYDAEEQSQLREKICLVRSLVLAVGVLGMGVCALLSPLISLFAFGGYDHSLPILCLSPVLLLLAVANGEMAVLKATRRLKRLARQSVYNVLAALLVSAPLYWQWGMAAIVPVLVLVAAAQMLIVAYYSLKDYPYTVDLRLRQLSAGVPMVKLGLSFVGAGVMGSGAEMIIRAFINQTADMDTVGLYNAAFMMTMTYAGMAFSALESDYFPRLSMVCNNVREQNHTVNRQIEIGLLLVAPLLVALIVALPVVIPILFSNKFMGAVPMAQITMMGMLLRGCYLPRAYLTIAQNESKAYLTIEAFSDVVMIISVVLGFHYFSLVGAGAALVATNLLDLLFTTFYIRRRYGYRSSRSSHVIMLVQGSLVLAAYLLTLFASPLVYILAGSTLTITSAAYSFAVYRRLKQ